MIRNHEDFVIGIDLGTGSCKTLLLDVEGKNLGSASSHYEANNVSSKWTEQDPKSLYHGLLSSLSKALRSTQVDPKQCLGISIGGALHSLMAINHNNDPLSGVITWADRRSTHQSEAIHKKFQKHRLYQRSGCPNNPMYPLSKIIWMREVHKDLYPQVAKFISAKEYVVWKLTGNQLVDYAIASGSGLLNINTLEWDKELLEIAGIKEDKLFALADPLIEAGQLNADIAHQVGLVEGIPIYLGSADAVNSSIGAGTTDSDSLTCMIGTSGAIRTIHHQPVLDEQERLWCYAIDKCRWLVGGAINNGGLALDWLRSLFNKVRPEYSEIEFKQLVDWAAEITPGAEGLICLPFLTHERSPYWNPYMRAVLFGLTLQHDHRHVARALLEGIGFRMKSVLDVLEEVFKKEFKEIIASGGFTASPAWAQINADIFNHSLSIPGIDETSAMGAAYWVLRAQQAVHSMSAMKKLVGISKVYQPHSESQPAYEKVYAVYKEIYFASRKIFEEMG